MAGIDDSHRHASYRDLSEEESWRSVHAPNVPLYQNSRPKQMDLQPRTARRSPDEGEVGIAVRQYVGVGVGLATIITENLLSHPFVVLRRQCQVHNCSRKYHLVPFTLLPVIVRLEQRQGVNTFCKGLGSVLFVRGMALAVEDFMSKFTPCPKEITAGSSWKLIGQHLLLKCVSLAITTPFYSASLVETVQSDIASEKPGIFDVFKEGATRLVSWGSPRKGRMLPVWALVAPTVICGLLKYIVAGVTRKGSFLYLMRRHRMEEERQGAYRKEPTAVKQDIEVSSSIIGLITAEVLLFPLETILHRLHLQGTRTIIDNLDSGKAVTPILTSYAGLVDCYRTTLEQEGFPGLYKGFGALVLQFAAHIAVIKVVKVLIIELGSLLTGVGYSKPPQEAEFVNSETFGPSPSASYVYGERPDLYDRSDNSYSVASVASVSSTRSVSPVMRQPRYLGDGYMSP